MRTGLWVDFPDNREKYREKWEKKNCPDPFAFKKRSIYWRLMRFSGFGLQGRKIVITGKRKKITGKTGCLIELIQEALCGQ
jgi:hypothetical protein